MATKDKAAPKTADRNTAVDRAAAKHKQATGRDLGTDNARARAAKEGEPQGNGNAKANAAAARESKTPLADAGVETVTQVKRSIRDDGIDPMTMDAVGKGSITEEAPAVRGDEAPTHSDRVVQQGDEVMLITKNPVNGKTENIGKVLKINLDGTLAVRVDAGQSGVQDFTGVGSTRTEDTNPYWLWPAKE